MTDWRAGLLLSEPDGVAQPDMLREPKATFADRLKTAVSDWKIP